MKLIDSLLLSAAVGFFVIGLNETFTRTMPTSFSQSYWIYMLSLMFLLLYQVRKVVYPANNNSEKTTPKPAPKKAIVAKAKSNKNKKAKSK